MARVMMGEGEGSIYLIHAHTKDITHWDSRFLCEDLLLGSVLCDVLRLFLLWPGHWSLINALRMKVRFSVSNIGVEREVIFSPEPLLVLQKGQAALCWEKFNAAIISLLPSCPAR